jgi:hypothetical protein
VISGKVGKILLISFLYSSKVEQKLDGLLRVVDLLVRVIGHESRRRLSFVDAGECRHARLAVLFVVHRALPVALSFGLLVVRREGVAVEVDEFGAALGEDEAEVV